MSFEIERHGAIHVVRDDLIEGGTKTRVIPALFKEGISEYVYASPAEGFAQIALAIAARKHGKQATIFTAERKEPHENTKHAMEAGARIVTVSPGYLAVVRKRAADYCAVSCASLLPFGLDCKIIRDSIAALARQIDFQPKEVWAAAGSGTLIRALPFMR